MQGLWYGCRGLGGLQASKQVAGSLLVARIGGLQASKQALLVQASGLTAGGKKQGIQYEQLVCAGMH